MTFTLTDIPRDTVNQKLVILAAEPRGNGITKAQYDAKYGATSAEKMVSAVLSNG